MAFKPKRIEEPEDGPPPPRPTSAELAAALAPAVTNLIPTALPAPKPDPPTIPPVALIPAAPPPALTPARPRAEPVLMMSFKASKPFAKMLAEAAEKEGGLRRLVARVFSEAGYPVPQAELQPQKRRRTYD